MGSLSYVASAALGLWFARGALGAVLLLTLGVLALSGGAAALLGPRLRGRSHPGSPVSARATAVGVVLAVIGLGLLAVGTVRLVDWATG